MSHGASASKKDIAVPCGMTMLVGRYMGIMIADIFVMFSTGIFVSLVYYVPHEQFYRRWQHHGLILVNRFSRRNDYLVLHWCQMMTPDSF